MRTTFPLLPDYAAIRTATPVFTTFDPQIPDYPFYSLVQTAPQPHFANGEYFLIHDCQFDIKAEIAFSSIRVLTKTEFARVLKKLRAISSGMKLEKALVTLLWPEGSIGFALTLI